MLHRICIYGVTQAYSIIKREMQNAHEMSQSDSKWQFVRGSIISENEVTLLKLTLDQNYDRLQKLIFSNFIFSKGRHLKWQFSYQTAPNNLVLKTSFPTLDYSRKKVSYCKQKSQVSNLENNTFTKWILVCKGIELWSPTLEFSSWSNILGGFKLYNNLFLMYDALKSWIYILYTYLLLPKYVCL